MKYQKLPIVVDAFLLGVDEPPRWFADAVHDGDVICYSGSYGPCRIQTLEGSMLAKPKKDYIVKGVDGELYPCKADIFKRTYRRIENDADVSRL